MSRSIRALNAPIHRIAGPLTGIALLACCFGQTCNLNPQPDSNVLASTPDAPDTDSTLDTVEPSTDATDDTSGDKRFSGQPTDRVIDANERDTITVDYSSLRGAGRTFTWKQISGPTVTIRATAMAVAAVSLPSVNADAKVILTLTQNTTHGPTYYLIQINVHELDALVKDVAFRLSTTSGLEPLSVIATVVTVSGSPVSDAVYSWDFGDGSVAEGTQVNHSFNAGVWTVKLCATFGSGLATTSGCKETTVNVLARPTDGSAFVVSGTVTANGAGLAGVHIAGDQSVTPATTDIDGNYALIVPAGWSGSLTGALDGYVLLPIHQLFNVQSDVSGQDYSAIALNQNNSATISGTILVNGAPLSGILVAATNGVASVTTGSDGVYSITVPADWTGIITPQMAGFAFAPPSRAYPTPTSSIAGQDFSATPVNQIPVARAGNDRTIMIQSGNSVSVHLDGSGSFDPDGAVVAYVWSENGATIATTPQTDVNLAVGAHTFKLQVTDNEGAVGEDTAVLSIGIPNSYYVATNGNDNWSGRLPSPNSNNTDGPFRTPNKAASITLPGDTVYLRGGTYSRTADQLYGAGLEINNSGSVDAPTTYRNFPGETPIIQGTGGCIWAIRIGYVKYDGTPTAVHDVIVDGLHATLAPWDGIEVSHSWNIMVRNCHSYSNNFNSPNGYKAGVNIDAGHDITIDHCRIFDNGFGICGYENQPDGHEWPNPSGPDHVTLSNNFVFANSRTGNMGNSPGMDIRFASHCTYEGNIFYDNPDAGINGEGNNFCRVLRNICINNWQPGGNNEGGKICVRGGGCNLIAFNLFANNGNCGWDATSGVGDVLLNNTFYGNGSWGILAEGSQMMLWNNILAANSTRITNNAYPQMDALGFSLVGDWNIFGSGPLVYQSPNPPIPTPPNTHIQAVTLPGVTLPRTDIRQVNTPEMLWGVSTIEEARAIILAAYKPAAAISGTTFANVQARCNANIPVVMTALDAAITRVATSPDFQMKQATSRWQALKAELTSYDLSGLSGLGGEPIVMNGSVQAGAAQ